MRHIASPSFWECYSRLPEAVQRLADKNFELMKADAQHPSLHLKNVGTYWSVRIGARYRALAVQLETGLLWFWIGTHSEYDRLTR
jgi:hypothetical protein